MKKRTFFSKLELIYMLICRNDLLGFLLFYFKISIVHIAFEAVFTVLYIAPLVVYPEGSQTISAISLSDFFGNVMLTSAFVFTIIIALYIVILFIWCILVIWHCKPNRFSFWIQIRRITFFGIIVGIIVYVIGGIIVSRFPDVFAGIKVPALTTHQKNSILIRIIFLGIIWAIQSYLRYMRINKNMFKTQNSIDFSCKNENAKPVNENALFFRMLSIVFQAITMCIIVLLLISSYKHIPYSKDTFVTICYKSEIANEYPGVGVCCNKSCVMCKDKEKK